jgi:hypothetical protein
LRSSGLTGRAAPALHGGQNAAQDVHFILIEFGALQETPDAGHKMRATLGAIAEIDLFKHLR